MFNDKSNDLNHKLNRKDKVYLELRNLTQTVNFNEAKSLEKIGFETNHIAKQLTITRNNVSTALNTLLSEGKVIKILGKPVRYLDRICLESNTNIMIKNPIINSTDEFKKLIRKVPLFSKLEEETFSCNKNEIHNLIENHTKPKSDIFENIVGAGDDLKVQVKQARAAILYPPNGLHTLLIGPTGIGKTTFAEIMYRYAIEIGRLQTNAPYVIFNCADYAENLQLLVSHLFGNAKGAFTGADTEKKGLVDQANGGILFLDEVHRLPPEGQEMLFSLMDRGSYRRLGESENTRKANILIIAATTEDPKEAILGTLLRRIPVIIMFPSLAERSLKGRMTLICQFFREESVKVKIPVTVSKEVLKILLIYKCPGNIGQLKNDIQLMCANAFVEYVTEQHNYVHVKLSQLSPRLKEGFFTIDNKRQEIAKVFNLNDFESITFNGVNEDLNENLNNVLLYDEYKTEEDFYDLILESAQKFLEKGLSISEIRERINKQIQNRFQDSFAAGKDKSLLLEKEILSKIVTPEIVKIIEESLAESVDLIGLSFDTKVIYSLALHMETLIERLRLGQISIHPNIKKIYQEHQQEYAVAEKIKNKLEEKLFLTIPDDEVAFTAMLLYSLNIKKSDENIEVLVITHGYATATNMVQVAQTLLGYECIHALDMPLEEKVEVILEKAIEMVKKINKGRGVLLLVDMGSLTTFSEIISERTGIPTRTVKMVSTPMVIEAARKAMMPTISLDQLVESVNGMSPLIAGRIKVDNSPVEIGYSSIIYQERAIAMLEEILTFLNVKKASKLLCEVLEQILHACDGMIDESIKIKFLFHCSCMIERIIRNEPLPYNNFLQVQETKASLFRLIKSKFILIEEVFGINIPNTELAYIVEMIDTHINIISIMEN
ncbi:sigma-54-dependent transcriptional regulator [Pelosinus sp. UFO1]|uniref:sigma-54-dependent transcriptional regulator n=1 Tax=Pelosinus sp. UFO1 TaxID=484770 RepID=UPI00056DF8B0|nr:sigma 54-interacting transcriptional regulator [Pelosinus sp. UFO1]